MTNEKPSQDSYSLEKLLALISESPAYAELPAAEKSKIQEHIKLNNLPVLIYIYQKLSAENNSLNISRDNLSKKVLTLKPSDQQSLRDNLHNL